ncbi:MAG: hypothetical protein ACR652_21670 [Methylocystis sp.]|uniref:hypothetical protein n=1 Tax=Methylocystis sp. TaxID=1911079 RepID=UPI003DA29FE3
MADYYSLISRAISALPGQTPDTRQGVYERARKALVNQLRSIQPPVAEADIAAESRALEEAIARLEIELARANAQSAAQKTAPATQAARANGGAAPGSSPAAAAPAAQPRAAEPGKAAPESQPAPRSAEDAWRDTLAATAPANHSREPQRPAAPLPRPPSPQRPPARLIALGGVLVSLIAVVGALAWYLRERPEDLARLKPAETASKGGDSGKFGERIEGGAATGPKRVTSVPVAQKAELWVATAQEPDKVDRIYNANVVWRLENVGGGPGQPVSSAVRGEVDIPDAKLKMSLLFQKNTDSALSASHTINISFKPQAGNQLGNVKAIGPIQMRRPDAQAGEKLVGIPVPITENNFLIGLMRGDREARNVQLLRSLSVLDLPLQFVDGRPATINMEKGASGERVFADAIDSWSR